MAKFPSPRVLPIMNDELSKDSGFGLKISNMGLKVGGSGAGGDSDSVSSVTGSNFVGLGA